jgi:OCT family organic cation transporter-like MFS transporter 4/5
LLPESPRWLISKGKTEEARSLMTRAAKRNGKNIDLSQHVIKTPEVDASKKTAELGFTDLFKTKDVLIITIVMFLCWPIITMGFFGLGLSMTQLGGNIFVSFILGAVVEVQLNTLYDFISE